MKVHTAGKARACSAGKVSPTMISLYCTNIPISNRANRLAMTEENVRPGTGRVFAIQNIQGFLPFGTL